MNFLLHLFIMDLVTDCEVTVILRSDLKLYLRTTQLIHILSYTHEHKK